ncbi:hypothetical protein LCGC14_0146020 [marine sediment metagenome]|uniref:Uncharacterized protein n=1 Tax=marine sediment metagenome TaxID=412755 RepID=A0A0F9XHG2_9ZZZZ
MDPFVFPRIPDDNDVEEVITRNISVYRIVKKHLIQRGFDGLVSSDSGCSCLIEDLMPCSSEAVISCEPGYRGRCNPDDCCLDGDCEYHIYSANHFSRSDAERGGRT